MEQRETLGEAQLKALEDLVKRPDDIGIRAESLRDMYAATELVWIRHRDRLDRGIETGTNEMGFEEEPPLMSMASSMTTLDIKDAETCPVTAAVPSEVLEALDASQRRRTRGPDVGRHPQETRSLCGRIMSSWVAEVEAAIKALESAVLQVGPRDPSNDRAAIGRWLSRSAKGVSEAVHRTTGVIAYPDKHSCGQTPARGDVKCCGWHQVPRALTDSLSSEELRVTDDGITIRTGAWYPLAAEELSQRRTGAIVGRVNDAIRRDKPAQVLGILDELGSTVRDVTLQLGPGGHYWGRFRI